MRNIFFVPILVCYIYVHIQCILLVIKVQGLRRNICCFCLFIILYTDQSHLPTTNYIVLYFTDIDHL